jgi:hypothetical protein
MNALKCPSCEWNNFQYEADGGSLFFPSHCERCNSDLDDHRDLIWVPTRTADAIERLAKAIESIGPGTDERPALTVAVRSEERPAKTGNGALCSQRAVVIWLAVAAIVLAAVFPPWSQGVRAGLQIPLAYGPIWSPPNPAAQIDLERLIIEWVLVGAVTGGLLLTLEQFVAFASARRKAHKRVAAAIALCGILMAVGLVAVVVPQFQEAYRKYVSDYKTGERSSAWTAYADHIRRGYDARVSGQDPSSVLDYLGNGRYRASSYVESSRFEGRLFLTTTLKTEGPSGAHGASTWLIEIPDSFRKTPSGPTVDRPPWNFDFDVWGPVAAPASRPALGSQGHPKLVDPWATSAPAARPKLNLNLDQAPAEESRPLDTGKKR